MAALMTIDTAYSASAASDAEDVAMTQVADFETIFLRFQGMIIRFIARKVDNYELAFDLAQDVFIKAYKALLSGTTIPQKALLSWLCRIASNTVIDTQRRQRALTFLSLSLFNEEDVEVSSPSTGTTTVSTYRHDEEDERPRQMTVPRSRHGQSAINTARFEERVAEHQIIERVFERLSPNYRACLRLHEYEDFSYLEIGQIVVRSPQCSRRRAGDHH